MTIEQDIEVIRAGIRAGRFPNEASVSQGIVLRLLNSLDWPTFEPEHVSPEYSLAGRRVDFALCSPPGKPFAFIEVKQIGQSDGAERQLFEYAFHVGVPMAILTDGREWNFFLPAEQGDYGERRVYKLDLVERELVDCASRLRRYLLHSAVASGQAITNARDDYKNVSRERQMAATLPLAWNQIISEEDEMLLEIVADRVESLCGFKPDPDMVAKFLRDKITPRRTNEANAQPAARGPSYNTPQLPSSQTSFTRMPVQAVGVRVESPKSSMPSAHAYETGFTLDGRFRPTHNAIDTLKQVFDALSLRDPKFLERFAGLPRHGRIRRYLALNAEELYPGRSDLVQEYSIKLTSGYWMGTNHSKNTIGKIIEMACDVARIRHGKDLTANLGD